MPRARRPQCGTTSAPPAAAIAAASSPAASALRRRRVARTGRPLPGRRRPSAPESTRRAPGAARGGTRRGSGGGLDRLLDLDGARRGGEEQRLTGDGGGHRGRGPQYERGDHGEAGDDADARRAPRRARVAGRETRTDSSARRSSPRAGRLRSRTTRPHPSGCGPAVGCSPLRDAIAAVSRRWADGVAALAVLRAATRRVSGGSGGAGAVAIDHGSGSVRGIASATRSPPQTRRGAARLRRRGGRAASASSRARSASRSRCNLAARRDGRGIVRSGGRHSPILAVPGRVGRATRQCGVRKSIFCTSCCLTDIRISVPMDACDGRVRNWVWRMPRPCPASSS